jgi:transposase
VDHRLGRTVLLTNRLDWSAEQGALGYSGQQEIEKVFRGLKEGEWLGWGPMYHWTDRKIRIHAFYCLLGICCCSISTKKPSRPGTASPPSNCWKSYVRFNSSF